MALGFRTVDRDQRLLLPPDMRDWLPADHEALFVIDVVAAMDLTSFEAAYRLGGVGRRAYQPAMMVALLLYAYSQGVESSRAIERACADSVAFRVVSANQQPDHSAIARFRATHEDRLKDIFVQALGLCAAAGLVRLGVIAVDGTKISANASLDANRTREGIEAEIAAALARHRANDEADDTRVGDGRGDELPPDMADPHGRVERLRQAARRAADMTQARAHRRRGTVQANLTDPDSARVQDAAGGILQGYNAQVAVGEGQLVLAVGVTNEATDYHQLEPLLEAVAENLTAAGVEGRPEAVVADAGYATTENLAQPPDGPERLIATARRASAGSEGEDQARRRYDRARTAHEEAVARMAAEDQAERERRAAIFERVRAGELSLRAARAELGLTLGPAQVAYRRWCQGGVEAIPVRQRRRPVPPRPPTRFHELRWAMERKLAEPANRRRYRQRAPLAEGAFSQLKRRGELRRFQRRGLSAVRSEWALRATVHNLRKLRSGLAGRAVPSVA